MQVNSRCPNDRSDHSTSKMTAAFTTRYMYSSPRNLIDAIRRWLNLKMFSCLSVQSALESTHLHADADILHDLVHDSDGKVGVIPLQVMHESRCQAYVLVLGLPDVGEGLQNEVVRLTSAQRRSGQLTSASSQCSLRRSTSTLSWVRFMRTSKSRCWMNACIGGSSTTSRATRSGGLH